MSDPNLSPDVTEEAVSMSSRSSTTSKPRITNWEINKNGGITGKVYGHEHFSEGHKIETSEIVSGEICQNGIVQTRSGSMYVLGKSKEALFDQPVPVTVEGVHDDTVQALETNLVHSLYEKTIKVDNRDDTSRSWTSTRETKFVPLQYGNLDCDESDYKNFVFVPKDFDFYTETGFKEVMTELGIKSSPELSFIFKENSGVVPNLDEKETNAYYRIRPQENVEYKKTWDYRRDLKYPNPIRHKHQKKLIETRVESIIKALADACGQSNAIFLLTEPHTGNTLSEMACTAANKHGVKTLGLFVAQDFSHVVEDDEKSGKFGKERLFLRLNNIDIDEYLSKDHQVPNGLHSSTHRWFHDPKIFNDNPEAVVKKGETPTRAIRVTTKRTRQEETFNEVYRHQSVLNGLSSECSHRLVFEERKDKESFEKIFLEKFPSGFVVVGSQISDLDEAVKCLIQSRPLFILKNSGATSNAVSELVYLGNRFFRGDFKKSNPGGRNESDENAASNSKDDLAFLPSDMQKKVQTLDSTQQYIFRHFPPVKGTDEAIHHFFPDLNAARDRDLGRELAIDDFIWYEAKGRAETFSSTAPRFNPGAIDIFDVGIVINVNDLQNRITKVISNSFNFLPELGGLEKDKEAVGQAIRLQQALGFAKARYQAHANLLQSIIRLVLFGTTALAVAQQELVQDGTMVYDVLSIINIGLPLAGSMFMFLDSTFRPSSIFAALLLAEKRLESERYRFLTRTGAYRVKRSNIKKADQKFMSARQKFADRCKDYYDACMKSDFNTGSLFKAGNQRKTDEQVYDSSGDKINDDDDPGVSEKATSFNPVDPQLTDIQTLSDKPTSSDLGGDQNATKELPSDASELIADIEEGLSARGDTNDLDLVSVDIITAEEYLEQRLKPKLVEYYREVPGHSMNRFYLRSLVIGLTGGSAALAALDLEAWVPVAIAAAAMFEFSSQYYQLDTRVPLLNSCAGELMKIYMWWNGLTLIQTRFPSFKDQLVDRVESAISSQYEQLAGTTVSLANQRYEEYEEMKNSENGDGDSDSDVDQEAGNDSDKDPSESKKAK